MTFQFFLLPLILLLSGCATVVLDGPQAPAANFNSAEFDYLAEAEIKVVDNQRYGWLAEELPPSMFQNTRSGVEKTIFLEVNLKECETQKEFWQVPVNLLTIFVLTIGKIDKCTVTASVTDLKSQIKQNYQTTTREFSFSGLAPIFLGPFTSFFLQKKKVERARATYRPFLVERKVVPR